MIDWLIDWLIDGVNFQTRDMHSKIDETAMEEFMAKANLAGRTFAADRAASSRLIHTVGADGGPTVVLATKRQEGTKVRGLQRTQNW